MTSISYFPLLAQITDPFLLAKEYFWDRHQLLCTQYVDSSSHQPHRSMSGDQDLLRTIFLSRKRALNKADREKVKQIFSELFPGFLDEKLDPTSLIQDPSQPSIRNKLAEIRQRGGDETIIPFVLAVSNLQKNYLTQPKDTSIAEEIQESRESVAFPKLRELQRRASWMCGSHAITLIASVALIIFGVIGTYLGGLVLGLSGFCLVGRVVSLSYYSRMQNRIAAPQR